MGFVYAIIIVAFWAWVVRKILDIDKRTKEIMVTLNAISTKLNDKDQIQ
jgi:aspartate carbamoyltransferase regulatory subunit